MHKEILTGVMVVGMGLAACSGGGEIEPTPTTTTMESLQDQLLERRQQVFAEISQNLQDIQAISDNPDVNQTIQYFLDNAVVGTYGPGQDGLIYSPADADQQLPQNYFLVVPVLHEDLGNNPSIDEFVSLGAGLYAYDKRAMLVDATGLLSPDVIATTVIHETQHAEQDAASNYSLNEETLAAVCPANEREANELQVAAVEEIDPEGMAVVSQTLAPTIILGRNADGGLGIGYTRNDLADVAAANFDGVRNPVSDKDFGMAIEPYAYRALTLAIAGLPAEQQQATYNEYWQGYCTQSDIMLVEPNRGGGGN